MKKPLILLLSLVFLFSCGEGENSSNNEIILTDSSGNINHVAVIMENEQWEGQIGEALRNNLAAPVEGLPQEEPLFSLSQIPPQSFSGFVRKNRLFLKIEKNKQADIKVLDKAYARPQTGIIISGKTDQEIVDIIKSEANDIINTLKRSELVEKQRRIRKSLKPDDILEENLGVSLQFPSAYRYAVAEEDFVWLRKEIRKGNMEIIIYEVPLATIDNDENSIIGNIIQMRDSIGAKYIPGPIEGSHMITEKAYAPYLFETQIEGKFAYETRGTWEVTNAFMAGPFLTYVVRDEVNNRYVILEGFVFSPSTAKRDNMFEIDAILQTARIN